MSRIVIAAIVLMLLSLLPSHAAAHVGSCDEKSGVEKARCERHQKMFDKCGVLKSEEHFVCDRAFLLANPLDCGKQTGEEKAKCEKEIAAFKICEPQAGREFMRCVRKEAGSSPMGH
ncbi:MAG: hypothetical protein JNM76_13315 [Betaproteobacteria bacterium]|nr:hypothetical protein [Betaproteobacteria bacterium]